MTSRERVWSAVDDVLAAIGFLLILGPLAAIAGLHVESSGRWWVALVPASAALGAAYRRRGHDIGDLGSFVLAVSVAVIPVAILGGAAVLATGVTLPPVVDDVLILCALYGVGFWYAYGGGRERIRGRRT